MAAQASSELLAKPRTQHYKRSGEKRNPGDCQARIYFGGRPAIAAATAATVRISWSTYQKN